MSDLLESQPEPVIISDSHTRSLSIFGGVISHYRNYTRNHQTVTTSEILASVTEYVENLSPLIDDAYRTELSPYHLQSEIVTSIEPLKRKLRSYPSSTADWKIEDDVLNDFRSLQGIVLQNFIEGRHTTFGLKPEKNQLLYIHLLNKDARKIHEFIGQLQLKILRLLARDGKIHYFNQQENMLILH